MSVQAQGWDELRDAYRTRRKLTLRQADEMRGLHATGYYSIAGLARRFHVSKAYAWQVIHGRRATTPVTFVKPPSDTDLMADADAAHEAAQQRYLERWHSDDRAADRALYETVAAPYRAEHGL